jgi:hypothetical protein
MLKPQPESRRLAMRTLFVGNPADWLLRLLTVGALAIDVYIHAVLAGDYDFTQASISQGDLFRIEAGAAALAALLILLIPAWQAWAFAFLVLAGGLGAVLLYRYVNVGAFGPFPNMYEPIWFPKKTASAIAEAAGAVTALSGLLLALKRRFR